MFKRKNRRSLIEQVKQVFWPSMGWRRFGLYLKHRTLRLSDSPRNIALGLAIGAGVSFSPIMFTHFVQAGILAFIFRANLPAAIIGTAIGNPWTFPLIWWASLGLGSGIFAMMGFPVEAMPPDNMTWSMMWDMILNNPKRLFFPWMLGGYILCVIITLGLYYIYYPLIKGAQSARRHKFAKEHKQ
ncbi:MAG: DUF2062 domain-containing protein [Bdellovibrionales bacterium]